MESVSEMDLIDVYRKLVRRETLTSEEEAVVLRAVRLLVVATSGGGAMDLAALEKGTDDAFRVLCGDDDGAWTS